MVSAPDATVATPIKISPADIKATIQPPTQVEVEKVAKFDLDSLLKSSDKSVKDEATKELVDLIKVQGPAAFKDLGLVEIISKILNDKKSTANEKESICGLISTCCEQGIGHSIEPIIIPSLLENLIVDGLGDKSTAVRQSALDALRLLFQIMTPWSTGNVLPILLDQIKTTGKWQIKIGCLELLDQLIIAAPDQLSKSMPSIIPVLTDVIWDTKPEVKKFARSTLTKICQLVSNKDIEKFIPALINCLINPDQEVPKTINVLAATTFVSEVDSPTLSLMVPLLSRGLNERLTATKRKVAVIIDNMSKLVDNELTVRPFLPKLLPGLIKIESNMADPEARSVLQRAIKTLRDVGKVEGDGTDAPPPKSVEFKTFLPLVKDSVKIASDEGLIEYISRLVANLANARNGDELEWQTALSPYITLAGVSNEQVPTSVKVIFDKASNAVADDLEVEEDEELGEDLCNCTFSLAYGAKILLNTATLRLKRGHRYGLCGRNGSGKSTLMTAIVNGQVEGFPSPEEVRTFYVAHDLDSSVDTETTCLTFILNDKRINKTELEVKEALSSVGFNEDRQGTPIGGLSGGWKMKLALARAVLYEADILLLDEPTNHMDVVNIAWLESYLTGLKNCTSVIVSHDSSFLNNVTTDILHLDRFKIKRYSGNLENFVKKVPEARAYYELSPAEDYTFKLPAPPLLDGVKTKEKSIMKMRKVGFKYPTAKEQQLYDITLQVSLSSRVAILGPNGSGKSTLVKLLVGDMEPNVGGEVWKHPNLVIGYVAQHAFHHIEQHLDKTPLEYMIQRYQTGEDLEELAKVNRQITPEDEKKMKEGANIVVEGQKRVIDDILSRRKLKQSYEYEISFKGLSLADNIYLPRDDLVKRGFEKKVQALDTKEAQRLGLLRPLVRKEVESHFNDFGLEAEFVSHNSMRGLSGGQKVKVVLAAATWRRPHVVILDEPSNYLDRESLAALIEALKSFEGGVLIITHNRELSEGLCTEVWAMSNARLQPSGHNWIEGQGSGARIDKKEGEEEDTFDALGNKVDKAKQKKKLTSAEARKAKKDRMARRKRGEEVFSDDDS